MATISKTYAPGGTSATERKRERPLGRPADHDAQEHLMLDIVMLALGLGFFARTATRPGSRSGHASLENALEEHNHDLRLFARRHRLRWPAVLPDLRPAAARAVLTALHVEPALTEGTPP